MIYWTIAVDRLWMKSLVYEERERERKMNTNMSNRSINYLSTVVDDSFLVVGGLSRVVDTVAVCGDNSRRSFPLLDVFIVRPLVDDDDEDDDDASFNSLLVCVVDGNEGP